MSQLPHQSRSDLSGNPPDHGGSRGFGGRGTGVAVGSPVTRAVIALAIAFTMPSCVILKEPSAEMPPNIPPVVVADELVSPATKIRVVNRDRVGSSPDGGSTTGIDFRVLIRDRNVEDDLTALVFLDRDEGESAINTPLLPNLQVERTGELERQLTFSVPREEPELDVGCHVLEVHVSREFTNFRNPQPLEPGDLGRATWFLAVVDSMTPRIYMDDCPVSGDTVE